MQILYYILLFLLLGLSLYTDLKTCKVKNSIILPAILIAIVLRLIFLGVNGLVSSLAGIIIPVFLLFPLFTLKMLGAGDIKLLAGIGAVTGHLFVVPVLIYSFLSGGLIAALILLYRKQLRIRMRYFIDYFKLCWLTQSLLPYHTGSGVEKSSGFRFTLAIAAGCILQVSTGSLIL